MNLPQYRKHTAKTESVPSVITWNKQQVDTLLNILTHVSEALDVVKKEMFYRRAPKDPDYFQNTLEIIDDIINEHDPREEHIASASSPHVIKSLHCVLGLMTESGELPVLFDQLANGTEPFDRLNFKEELGDFCWYIDRGSDANDITMEDILSSNIKKLSARYPTGTFVDDDANNRDVDNEYVVMEK